MGVFCWAWLIRLSLQAEVDMYGQVIHNCYSSPVPTTLSDRAVRFDHDPLACDGTPNSRKHKDFSLHIPAGPVLESTRLLAALRVFRSCVLRPLCSQLLTELSTAGFGSLPERKITTRLPTISLPA